MCIPLAIALIGRDYYEARADLTRRGQEVEQTHLSLLNLYQKDTILLSVEQINPSFFEHGQTRLTEAHKRAVADLQQEIEQLQIVFRDDPAARHKLTSIASTVSDYEERFQTLLKQIRYRGFQDYGQVGAMRVLAHNIEEAVTPYPELRVHALMLRRHEKDYIIRNQEKYIERLLSRTDQFVMDVNQQTQLTPSERQQLIEQINAYAAQFLTIVNLDEAIGLRDRSGVFFEISTIKTQIENQYGQLITDIEHNFEALNLNLNQKLFGSIATLMLIALGLCLYLSRALTNPLIKLARRIRTFTDNDFKQPVSLHKLQDINDEVGNLALNFSALQDHILDSIDKLQKERTSAEEANKAKSLFLANMSHELRTPLNGIIGMTQLLGTSGLNDEQKSFTETIQHASASLLTIVSDILDFSKIEAGKVELDCEDFNLKETLTHIIKPLQIEADAKGIELNIDTSGLTCTHLHGDANRWSQIARNLLSNAIKFTSQGSINVTLKSVPAAQGVSVSLQVTDTGIGMSKDVVSHIFEAFRQADNSTTRKFGGTGLGLSISHELAQLMNGCITVQSTPGQGSTFTASVEMQAPRNQQTVTADTGLTADLKVLVAEDNQLNKKIIDRMLAKLGVQSIIVENGAEALAELNENAFDLVLMDIQMPVMDGLTAVAQLRESEGRLSKNHQLVYALTANATHEDRHQALQAGMDGFITKPISIQSLRETLQGLG